MEENNGILVWAFLVGFCFSITVSMVSVRFKDRFILNSPFFDGKRPFLLLCSTGEPKFEQSKFLQTISIVNANLNKYFE
jgi:hypothetical protein